MQLYKPNKSNKGHAIGLEFNSKDQNLFLSVIKQNGFNPNGKGKFNGGKQVKVALGAHEVGGILSVISDLKQPIYKTDRATLIPTRRTQEYHHESEKQSCKIKFSPYVAQDGTVNGLSFSVIQTDKKTTETTTYSFWAAPDEFSLLEEYLKFVLDHFFTADYSAKKKARDEKFKNGGGNNAPAREDAEVQQEVGGEEESDPFA
jgi:hypothetical protein